jgi:endonuclease III
MKEFKSGKTCVYVDVKRGIKIARILENAFMSQIGIFSNTQNLVEYQIPEGVEPLSKQHALFLFYIIPLDYLTKSELLYTKARLMFKNNPKLFDPLYISTKFNEDNLEELADLLRRYLSTRFPFEAAKRWYRNSIILLQLYEGDPRNIFKGSRDAKEIFKRISQFRGLGKKTGGLLLRCMVDLGFRVENINDIPPPVDIHDIKIAFSTKIAYSEHYSEKNARKFARVIQSVWSYICKKGNLNWPRVDRALWLLGSIGCSKKKCNICPISNFCTTNNLKNNLKTNLNL